MLVTARSWKFESSSGHQFKFKVKTLDFTETRESGFLRFWHLKTTHAPELTSQSAFEKQYRLSLLQVFAM
ncbi:hypothetical protein EMIT0P4_20410 [Pseudomonas sp. IT-P4]